VMHDERSASRIRRTRSRFSRIEGRGLTRRQPERPYAVSTIGRGRKGPSGDERVNRYLFAAYELALCPGRQPVAGGVWRNAGGDVRPDVHCDMAWASLRRIRSRTQGRGVCSAEWQARGDVGRGNGAACSPCPLAPVERGEHRKHEQ